MKRGLDSRPVGGETTLVQALVVGTATILQTAGQDEHDEDTEPQHNREIAIAQVVARR